MRQAKKYSELNKAQLCGRTLSVAQSKFALGKFVKYMYNKVAMNV